MASLLHYQHQHASMRLRRMLMTYSSKQISWLKYYCMTLPHQLITFYSFYNQMIMCNNNYNNYWRFHKLSNCWWDYHRTCFSRGRGNPKKTVWDGTGGIKFYQLSEWAHWPVQPVCTCKCNMSPVLLNWKLFKAKLTRINSLAMRKYKLL